MAISETILATDGKQALEWEDGMFCLIDLKTGNAQCAMKRRNEIKKEYGPDPKKTDKKTQATWLKVANWQLSKIPSKPMYKKDAIIKHLKESGWL